MQLLLPEASILCPLFIPKPGATTSCPATVNPVTYNRILYDQEEEEEACLTPEIMISTWWQTSVLVYFLLM